VHLESRYQNTKTTALALLAVATYILDKATTANGSGSLKFVIPTEANPDFLPRSLHQRRRMRLSSRKAA
jgi:hypothetical protein